MSDQFTLEKLDDLEPESVFDSKLLKVIRDLHFRICELEEARKLHIEEIRVLRRRIDRLGGAL
jgi:hypothetical protein